MEKAKFFSSTLSNVWYAFYIILNIVTLGSIWFLRNLMTYSIIMAFERKK